MLDEETVLIVLFNIELDKQIESLEFDILNLEKLLT
jgi:hypothetical protein